MRAKSIVACLVLILTAFASRSSAGEAVVARMSGIIGPSSARFMVEAIERAEERRAECVILEMDTPGGLDESMRAIVKKIMASKVPVVVYVAPPGSRAASAGVFITMAAHVAAMAPGTNIGAAHPVSIGLGAKVDSVMAGKMVNDAAAYARSIAGRRGRNAEWAEDAVRESVSISETEALKLRVIDLIAPSLEALLDSLDGRKVAIEEKTIALHTKGAAIVEMRMSWSDRLLAVITNPNVAYVLFMLGLLGLYFELSTPGAVLPGVVGAICLILAFFAFQVLSVSFTGVLLIILAIVLFIAEAKTATNGILTAGGLIAMTIRLDHALQRSGSGPARLAAGRRAGGARRRGPSSSSASIYRYGRCARSRQPAAKPSSARKGTREPRSTRKAAGFSWPAPIGTPFPTERSRRESASG